MSDRILMFLAMTLATMLAGGLAWGLWLACAASFEPPVSYVVFMISLPLAALFLAAGLSGS